MNSSTRIAFAEVDLILSLLESEYVNKVPKELRDIFYIQKDKNYNKTIDVQKPLTKQNLNKETIAILALLNYEYWCNSEEEKKNLVLQLCENEIKEEKILKEKYNPDNLFKAEKERLNTIIEETKKENLPAETIKKESFLSKLINKIKSFFSK